MSKIPDDVMNDAWRMLSVVPSRTTFSRADVAAYIARAIMAAEKRATEAAWQPIETAPKDGTEILCCVSGNRYFIGVAQWAERKDWDNNSVAGWFWPYAIRPTHWQPLPPPPASKGASHDPV